MRTSISFPCAFAFFLLLALTSYRCGKDDQDKCDSPIEIEQLLPDNNPKDYEIQIKGTGFTQAAVVRFGAKTAVTRWYAEESALIAKVPSGLSGLVEVTVEEGDCIARADFEVTSISNPDWPPSLTLIVIPQPPVNYFPQNFSNAWTNKADSNHGIQLNDDGGTIDIDPASHEIHSVNTKFNNNPVIGTIDTIANQIHLTIDRSANGGLNDTLDGQFILPSVVGVAAEKHVIWLQSKVNGRQLILLQP